MKAVDFAYWLQGYFEISGGALDIAKITAIYNKLQSVEMTAGNNPTEKKAAEFATNLYRVILPPPGGTLDVAQATATVKQQLHDLFIHAIDPSYDGDQNHFHGLHGGPGGNRPGVRC